MGNFTERRCAENMSRIELSQSAINIYLSAEEKEILLNLTTQLLELLGEVMPLNSNNSDDPFADIFNADAHYATPGDEVLERLFPAAYEDEADAIDFRKFTQDAIAREKHTDLNLMREQLILSSLLNDHDPKAEVKIANVSYEQWLMGLNSLRIALGVRLQINSESYQDFENFPPSDPRSATLGVYFWLGSLQEYLLERVAQLESMEL
jgi:Domain of unknown function (DUF2017)